MANQGDQGQKGQQTPTGTSGRRGGNSGSDPHTSEPCPGDQGPTPGGRRIRRDDDEESGLGNRITNR